MRRACRMLSAAVLGAVVMVAAACLVETAALAADEPDPVLGVPVFNDPTGSPAAQYAIFQQLARLIDRVPAGEDIEMSWFEFTTPDNTDTDTKPDIVDRLLRAHARGVHVQIVLDNNAKDDGSRNETRSPYLRLSPVLGKDDAASSYIVLCPERQGCIAKRPLSYASGTRTYAYNHNKFLTASRIVLDDGSSRSGVVFQASSNLGVWDAETAFNNAMTWNEPNSYAMYRSYFTDLHDMRTGAGDDDYYRVGDTADEFKVHYFPRRETGKDYNEASTDTIVGILDAVKCSYVGASDGRKHQSDIRVAMWSFNRVAVARKLAALVRAGCWVDVVYSTTNDSTQAALRNVGGKPIGITACRVPYQGRNVRVHSKYMLIDGAYDNDQIPRVFMGSHNFSVSSLRDADESMVRIRSAAVHERYLQDNFYRVRSTCNGTTPAAAAATVVSDAAGPAQETDGE